jgi:hypothetical protein
VYAVPFEGNPEMKVGPLRDDPFDPLGSEYRCKGSQFKVMEI